MIVEQIWTGNDYRNFNYLVVCPETGEALAIDPLDHEKCLNAAAENGWTITQVLNTHEHGDHIGGNRKVIAATGARGASRSGAVSPTGSDALPALSVWIAVNICPLVCASSRTIV